MRDDEVTTEQLEAAIDSVIDHLERARTHWRIREDRSYLRDKCMASERFRTTAATLVEAALKASNGSGLFDHLTLDQQALLLALVGASLLEGIRIGLHLADAGVTPRKEEVN